jgi:chemotaxis protein CheD
VHLAPGQLSVQFGPGRLRTILGSCVSVCLWDARLGLGGMNHFLLPRSASAYVASLRYGDMAMAELVNGLTAHGSRTSQLSARVYGGASVLAGLSDALHLGERNVEFALDWLAEAGITIDGRDVLGRLARRVEFDLTSGVSSVRLLGAQ